jgi:hypothetical protein
MNTKLVEDLASEIAAVEARLNGLRQAHSILVNGSSGSIADIGAAAGILPAPRANQVIKARKRAPSGFLEECILRVVGKDEVSNETIRQRLVADNYPYSLVMGHVSKALSGLVKAKQLKGIGSRSSRKYHKV